MATRAIAAVAVVLPARTQTVRLTFVWFLRMQVPYKHPAGVFLGLMVLVPGANFQNDSGGLPPVSFGNLPGSLNPISLYYGHRR